jgi:molybdopterin synthase catalytic subunit
MEFDDLRTVVAVRGRALDVAALYEAVRDDRAGASVIFTGMVRNHAPGKTGVTHLEYEAYDEHVAGKIEEICVEVRRQWNVLHIAVEHRTGTVVVGEPSVVVAVSSAHRGDAFEAGRYVIDQLKHRAPIWKKEHAAEGAEWVQGA